jgi:hypothetical protein
MPNSESPNPVKPRRLVPDVNPDAIQTIYDKATYTDAVEVRDDAILLRKYAIRLNYQYTEADKIHRVFEASFRTVIGPILKNIDPKTPYYEKMALVFSTNKQVEDMHEKLCGYQETATMYKNLYDQVNRLAMSLEQKAYSMGFRKDVGPAY